MGGGRAPEPTWAVAQRRTGADRFFESAVTARSRAQAPKGRARRGKNLAATVSEGPDPPIGLEPKQGETGLWRSWRRPNSNMRLARRKTAVGSGITERSACSRRPPTTAQRYRTYRVGTSDRPSWMNSLARPLRRDRAPTRRSVFAVTGVSINRCLFAHDQRNKAAAGHEIEQIANPLRNLLADKEDLSAGK